MSLGPPGPPGELFDTHCHLHAAAFAADLEEVWERARRAGVRRALVLATGRADAAAVLDLAGRVDGLLAACGIHPHEAAGEVDWPWWEETCARPEVCAIGEIGLDNHPAPWNQAPAERQREVFTGFLELARRLGKPALVHTRDAWPDMLAIVREHPSAGVLHGFSGGHREAEAAWAAGWCLGIGGPVGYPRNLGLREVVAKAPPGGYLLETDAPYLPPHGHRGERNEPAHLRLIAQTVASARSQPMAAVAAATTATAERFFCP